MIRYRSFAGLLLLATALAGCEENAVQQIAGSTPGARIKFFNFGVGSPGVNFYADETKMTAISSTSGEESTSGVNYGGAGGGGLYTGLEPGQYTFSGRIAAATDKDLPISSVTATLEEGKLYSYYQSGIYDAGAKSVDAFIVEDPVPPEFDYSVAYVRFVNASSNSNPLTLYGTRRVATGEDPVPEVAVGGAVAYRNGGAFTPLPEGVYDLTTRVTGSPDDVVTRAGVSFNAGRIYTITLRGDMTATATQFLDNTTNR